MVIGLGCEKLQPERLLQGTEDVKSIPVDSASIVSLQDEKHVGFKSMVDDILQVAERHGETEPAPAKPARPLSWWSGCSAAAATPFQA